MCTQLPRFSLYFSYLFIFVFIFALRLGNLESSLKFQRALRSKKEDEEARQTARRGLQRMVSHLLDFL